MYLQVLLACQLHSSCLFFWDAPMKKIGTVVDDALNLRLVVHILHEFAGSVVNHSPSQVLVLRQTREEILYTNTIY